MRVVATFHQPSVVASSAKCKLTHSDVEYLAIGKSSRLEIYSLRETGLVHECNLDFWGNVVSVKAVPIPSEEQRHNIAVLLAHPEPELIFLSFTEGTADQPAQLFPTKQLSLFERNHRPAEFYNDMLVDPNGEFIVVSCYISKLKIVIIEEGKYKSDFDVSIRELNIFSLTLLPGIDPVLAILHFDHQEKIQLIARDIDIEKLELSPDPSLSFDATTIAGKLLPAPTEQVPQLIPVPPGTGSNSSSAMAVDDNVDTDEDAFPGGVLVIGGTKILLYDMNSESARERARGKRKRLNKKKRSSNADEVGEAERKDRERQTRKRVPRGSVDWPWSMVTAWCGFDGDPERYLIGDAFGRMAVLSLRTMKDYGIMLIPLGEVSPPRTLTYLSNQIFYLGAAAGDSALVQITPSPSTSASGTKTEFTLPIPPGVKNAVRPESLSVKGKGRAIDIDADLDPDAEEEEDGEDEDASMRKKGCLLKTSGSFVKIVESHKNIAPIFDAVVADTDGSGVNQVVTCSGAQNSGSINIVRTGADFREMGYLLGLENVTAIWPIRTSTADRYDTAMVVSTLLETFVFKLVNASTFERLTDTPVVANKPTLAAGNFLRTSSRGGNAGEETAYMVQVTKEQVVLYEVDAVLDQFHLVERWEPGTDGKREIVAASVAPDGEEVLVATGDGRCLCLSVSRGESKFVVSNKIQDARLKVSAVKDEIAAVCASQPRTKGETKYYAVAYWHTNVVELFTSSSSSPLVTRTDTLTLSAPARSLLLCDLAAPPVRARTHLVAGLADGSLVHAAVRADMLKDMKVVSLGRAPVSVAASVGVEGQGEGAGKTVVACGERSVVLAYEKKRVRGSPVMLKDVVAVARIHSKDYENALVLASSSGLLIGRVADIDKLHIKTIPLGYNNPRRIAHVPELAAFVVLCTKEEPNRIGEEPRIFSTVKLIDHTTYREVANFDTPEDEDLTAVTTVKSGSSTYICIGTMVCRDEEVEPAEGRILLFDVKNAGAADGKAMMHVVSETKVKGCVYALKFGMGVLVAAINSSVTLFKLVPSSAGPPRLENVTSWNHNYVVTTLSLYENRIAVGDQICSVSLLEIETDAETGAASGLKTVGRDHAPLWPVAIESTGREGIIGGNDDGNLFAFKATVNTRATLEKDGSYFLGDRVTRLIKGSIVSTADSGSSLALTGAQVFVTVPGRIGVILDASAEDGDLLYKIQRNLASVTKGVGGRSDHTRYRAPTNQRGKSDADSMALGFLDGDFIEAGLERVLRSEEETERMLRGSNEAERIEISVEEVQRILEGLQAVH